MPLYNAVCVWSVYFITSGAVKINAFTAYQKNHLGVQATKPEESLRLRCQNLSGVVLHIVLFFAKILKLILKLL